MVGFFRAIIAVIIAVMIQGGVSGVVETDPADAVTEFMNGITTGNEEIMNTYMDNEYVNFLANVEGDEETTGRMVDAIFKNLEYKTVKTAQKRGVAVAKVHVKTNDFSKVMDAYDKASYKYVVENLYDEDIADKEKLSAECLDIYVQQIEKAAKKDASVEKNIYIPMISDGYGGWKLLIDDKIMKTLMGNLAMP